MGIKERPAKFFLTLPSRFKEDEGVKKVFDYFESTVDPILKKYFSNDCEHNYEYHYEEEKEGFCFYVEIKASREKIIKVGEEIVRICNEIISFTVEDIPTEKI